MTAPVFLGPNRLAKVTGETIVLSRSDYVAMAILACLSATLVITVTTLYGNSLAVRAIGGRWFQCDGWRAYDDILNFGANHGRNAVRPMFSLLAMPVALVLKLLFRLSGIQAIWIFNAIVLMAWTVLLYLIHRVIGLNSIRAAVGSVLGLVSGAVLFWFTVPETYPLSSTALLLCLLLAAIQTKREVPNWALVVSGALSLGTLVTNWWLSLVTNFVFKRAWTALVISLTSFILMMMTWGLQRVIYPQPAANPFKNVKDEKAYFLNEERGTSIDVLRVAIVSSMLVPKISEYDTAVQATGKRLTIQRSSLSASGLPYALLSVIWLVLLTWGSIRLLGTRRLRSFNVVLFGTLLGQLLLHLVYGEETFLYALHIVPLMTIIASGGMLRIKTHHAVIVSVTFAALLTFNSFARLKEAVMTTDIGGFDFRLSRLGSQ